ncbi:MAG: T9SS type A sorting domain-containing protein [Bacteroidales bacterium]|nr:T9SS type A sorting domain-containing protein [Bacteroidales bacterium]
MVIRILLRTLRLSVIPMILFLTALHLPAQDWKTIKTFQPAQTLHCIRFANDDVGYTVSSLYNGSNYNIHKTTDGGDTWTDQSSGYTATRFKDISIISEDTVLMCGNYGLVIRTFDGGGHWMADTVSPAGDHFFGICFVGHTGYVCGNSGAIYKTTDLGDNWTQVAPPFITAIEEIYFLDEDYGFICGLNFIYYTENGGATWLEPETFPGATANWWLRQFSFVDDSLGYVCGDIGQVYMTTDRGRNWEYLPNTGTQESLQAMIALDPFRLFACGFSGTVIQSFDGGEYWSTMTANSSQNFYSIDFTPGETGFICSHTGEVLRFDWPFSGINHYSEEKALTIYPNPATDRLYFNAKITSRYREVDLYNTSGQHMGIYHVNESLDISGLLPGAYILVFSGGGASPDRLFFVKQ